MSSSEIHSASASYFQIGPTGGINFSEGSTAKWDITRSGDTSARQVVSYWSTDGDYSTSSMDAAIVNLDFEQVNSSVIFNESETIKTVSAPGDNHPPLGSFRSNPMWVIRRRVDPLDSCCPNLGHLETSGDKAMQLMSVSAAARHLGYKSRSQL